MNKYLRLVNKILAIGVCLSLISGCTTYNDDSDYLTPVSIETLSAYEKIGSPINNRLDAVIDAQISMQGWRLNFVGNPQVVYAEQISFLEAIERVEAGDQLLNNQNKDRKVWLVIFEGELQMIFPMPDEQGVVSTLDPPYHGCMFYINSAKGEDPSLGGEVSCKAKIK